MSKKKSNKKKKAKQKAKAAKSAAPVVPQAPAVSAPESGSDMKAILTVAAFFSLFILVFVLVFADSAEAPRTPVEPSPTATSDLQLEVQPGDGSVPGDVGEFLQGSASIEQSPTNSQVEQPSQGLLDYLQPNSGESDFSDSRTDNLQ